MTQLTGDAQAIAQITLPLVIEIDSVEDEDFGTLYRLWKSYHFLGTFYQNLEGKWVAQAGNCKAYCQTECQAQPVILAVLGLVVPSAA